MSAPAAQPSNDGPSLDPEVRYGVAENRDGMWRLSVGGNHRTYAHFESAILWADKFNDDERDDARAQSRPVARTFVVVRAITTFEAVDAADMTDPSTEDAPR